ncbi:MAG: hypothetical protein HYY36_06040 [Gammaproteobacteria bacterium]|nr:hypothetical protein [Gammaproteobacteria bacterium]
MRNSEHKLISCILPRGIALDVLRKLRHEKGIIEASVNTARGMGKLTPLAHRGIGEQTEKDILNVVVPAERSDELLESNYESAHIDRPHGGMIFMHALSGATPFVLPDLPEEK